MSTAHAEPLRDRLTPVSIIQRAGIVPLSIAGIVKEVTTIMISAWVFGDELTGLNIVGVFITVSGIAIYSFHKYKKSIAAQENNHSVADEEAINLYTPARTSVDGASTSRPRETATSSAGADHRAEDDASDRWDNDGWDESWKDDEEDDGYGLGDESRDEEVLKARAARESGRRGFVGSVQGGARPGSLKDRLTRSWGPWWDQSM